MRGKSQEPWSDSTFVEARCRRDGSAAPMRGKSQERWGDSTFIEARYRPNGFTISMRGKSQELWSDSTLSKRVTDPMALPLRCAASL
jgi:hypothetical protein